MLPLTFELKSVFRSRRTRLMIGPLKYLISVEVISSSPVGPILQWVCAFRSVFNYFLTVLVSSS